VNRCRVVLMLVALTCMEAAAKPGEKTPQELEKERFERLCATPAAQEGYVQVIIDANTARVEGGLTLQPDSRVEVVFANKNPFKYRYRFGLSATSLDEAGIAQYLNTHLFKGTLSNAQLKSACPDDAELEGKVTAFTSKTEVIEELGGKYKNFLARTSGDSFDQPNECVNVLVEASGLVTKFRTHQAALDAMEEEYQSLVRDVNALKAGACKSKLETELGGLEVKAKMEELRKAAIFIGDRLAEDELIHARRYASVPAEPTLVEAQVFRTNLRQVDAKEQSVGEVEFKAGEGRVTVTAGAMYSNLDSRQVVRQATLARNADGSPGDVVETRFGYSEKSPFTIAPVLLLNVRVRDPYWAGWWWGKWVPPVHVTAGVLAAEEDGQPRLDFVAGLTVSFENLVFLTAGAHLGERDELAGFRVGDLVPADMLDPLPTQRVWRSAFTTALTFKFR